MLPGSSSWYTLMTLPGILSVTTGIVAAGPGALDLYERFDVIRPGVIVSSCSCSCLAPPSFWEWRVPAMLLLRSSRRGKRLRL
jgi:hypothetical protein